MTRIGKNIKKVRSEKGYTQEQLAQKLCVTRNTISNYETGHSNPDIEMLQMLAEALETDLNTLIYGEKKEQSADRGWRKEILKRVIWLAIAGLIIMVSASLIQYGGEIAKDTLRVPIWSQWLKLVAYPIAYMIIGSQLMALILRAYGNQIPDSRWMKAGFWVLVAVTIIWVVAISVDCIRYEYAWKAYMQVVRESNENILFDFSFSVLIPGLRIYICHKWFWTFGWSVYGMLLAIFKRGRKV